jgi:hypothetical protein
MTTQHFDQNQLAKRWHISPRTLERWRWQNDGPSYVKIGGRVVYRMEDVEAYESDRLHDIRRGPQPTFTRGDGGEQQ